MADNTLDIMIRILTQQVGPEKAQEIFKKIKEESKAANQEMASGAEKAAIKNSDLKKSIQLVSGEFGALGKVLHFVFNPGILGAAALGMSIGKVKDGFMDFLNGLKRTAANAALGIGDIKAAMLELEVERAKADVNSKASMESFERNAKRRVELINLEKEAVTTLLNAREKAELAAVADSPESDSIKEKISRRYGAARQRAGETASRKEIASRQQELRDLATMEQRATRAGMRGSGGRGPEATRLALKNLPDELKSLDEQIAEQTKANTEMSSITTVWGALPYWKDPTNYLASLAAYGSGLASLAALKRTRAKIAGRELPLTQASAAFSEAEGLRGKIGGGLSDIDALTADTTTRNRTGWQASAIEGGSGTAADLVMAGAGGADAIRGGGRATPGQAQAINQLAGLLGLQNQSAQTIINLISRLNDNQAWFANALKQVESKVNSNTRRTQ